MLINPEGGVLEGPAFDRVGNLFISSVLDGRILKITPDKEVTTILNKARLMPDGIAIHKDGRLFVACASGNIISMNPDGSNITYMKTPNKDEPTVFNDLVFDSKGNLYITDSSGTAANPTGGVYCLPAVSNYRTITPVYLNMAAANGIGVPPEGGVSAPILADRHL